MRSLSVARVDPPPGRPAIRVGTPGYLAVFVWTLGMVLLVRPALLPVSGLVCLVVAGAFHPLAFRRLLRPGWAVMFALLVLPPAFVGEPDGSVWGLPISGQGVRLGLYMGVRAVVILVAAQGLAASMDIASLAGLFERLGLHGLGFSMGVALNLLPALQASATHAWYSLKMRGGLRRKCRRGLQLLTITVATNALRRAEEIALAAEARGFAPEHSRALPIKIGYLDWVIVPAAALVLLLFGVIL